MDGRIQPGDRVLGRYRTDEYRATVLAADGDDDDVVVEWAPPHNKWGPATLKRRDVRFVSRPKPEHPLSTLLPGRLEDGSGDLVELDAAYDACDAVGIFFASGDTPPRATEAVVAARDALRRQRKRLGLALVEFDPAETAICRHRAKVPGDCYSVPAANVGLVVAHFNLMEACRVRELPSLCVVDPASGRILTYDGMDALDELPEGFPWDGFRSARTVKIERKARAMMVFAYFAGALLAGVGAYRVGGWLSSLLPGAPAEEAL